MQELYEGLCGLLSEHEIRTDEPMKKHTTFRIGGPADFFVTPSTAEQIAGVTALCRRLKTPCYVLGNGSNLLVGDKGFRGVVLAMAKPWSSIRIEEGCGAKGEEREVPLVFAGAGALLSAVAAQALNRGFTGMEFAAGIPGTLGGAVVMNAGAYGSELKDILREVTVLTADGAVTRLDASALALGYRTSCIPACGYIVLEAVLGLAAGDKNQIRERMEALALQRKTKQPLEYPSAGSTFKRPAGYFAGQLIQDAGLKGYRIGGAQVSDKHSGFVINRGDATAAEVLQLCRFVQTEVERQFGVTLELEVRMLGEFT